MKKTFHQRDGLSVEVCNGVVASCRGVTAAIQNAKHLHHHVRGLNDNFNATQA